MCWSGRLASFAKAMHTHPQIVIPLQKASAVTIFVLQKAKIYHKAQKLMSRIIHPITPFLKAPAWMF